MGKNVNSQKLLNVEMLEEVDNCETSFIAKKQFDIGKIVGWILS